MGAVVGHPADMTKKLIKNLAAEFQRIQNLSKISGCASTGPPHLRGSEELYTLFEEYYSVFFPHGGSICPKFVMTENQLKEYVYFI